MPHVDFHIKQDDTRPYIKGTVKNELGVAQNVSLANAILFSMETRDSMSPKINRAAAVAVDAPNGVVEYRWTGANDTDTPGIYFGEFIIDWDGAGDEQKVPNDGYLIIEVKAKVE